MRVLVLVLGCLAACGSDPAAVPMCMPGAQQCAGQQLQTCSMQGMWSTATDCGGDQRCRAGACVDPSATQLQQVQASSDYAQTLIDETGWQEPLDLAAIQAAARKTILDGDGSDSPYYAALWGELLSVPEGHQGLSNGKCNTPDMFAEESSRFGVCAQPHGDDLVVTFAQAGNPLGLSAGDLVTKAGDDAGDALFTAAFGRAMCGDQVPSPIGRRSWAASSFFGTVPVGMSLTVQPADGSAAHAVTIPADAIKPISCADPLGRDVTFNAKSSVRPDGVAVIRLPRFYPIDDTLPANPTPDQYQAFIDKFQGSVQAEFDKVKTAPAIVWDARGNGGGITPVGLAIVGGMPGAKAMNLSYCQARIPGSQPPAFDPLHYAVYDIVPGGPFAYAGKVSVILDGGDYSATDYFALALSKATTVPLIGAPTSGAFGGPGAPFALDATPTVTAFTDVNRCVDAATGSSLETHATMPTMAVEYDPADLVKGVDTVLEAAVANVR